MFQPSVGDVIDVDGAAYSIAAHPAMPKLPYGQEGREAVVYKLTREDGDDFALKVFKHRYRRPYLVRISKEIAGYATLPGMEVCNRRVIYAGQHLKLLKEYPDLVYAALMPWVEGPTWMEYILGRRLLGMQQSLEMARLFLKVLVALEEEGLSHGDLSGANVMLPMLNGGSGISLVDVEQLYIPGTERPETTTDGSPGYRFPRRAGPAWGPLTDRFPGSLILAEMLAFADGAITRNSDGESYFSEGEIGRQTDRYVLMHNTLQTLWGTEIASLFSSNWFSDSEEECVPFVEWLIRLPDTVENTLAKQPSEKTNVEISGVSVLFKKEPVAAAEHKAIPATQDLEGLLIQARGFEASGEWGEALNCYRGILKLEFLPAGYRESVVQRFTELEQLLETEYEESGTEDSGRTETPQETGTPGSPGAGSGDVAAAAVPGSHCGRCGASVAPGRKFCYACRPVVKREVIDEITGSRGRSKHEHPHEYLKKVPTPTCQMADKQQTRDVSTARTVDSHGWKVGESEMTSTFESFGLVDAPARASALNMQTAFSAGSHSTSSRLAASKKTIVTVLVLLAVLGGAAVAYTGLSSYLKKREVIDSVTIAAEAYVKNLRQANSSVAWEYLSQELKQQFGNDRSKFEIGIKSVEDRLKNCSLDNTVVQTDSSNTEAAVSLNSVERRFNMLKEAGEWKVNSNPWCEP